MDIRILYVNLVLLSVCLLPVEILPPNEVNHRPVYWSYGDRKLGT